MVQPAPYQANLHNAIHFDAIWSFTMHCNQLNVSTCRFIAESCVMTLVYTLTWQHQDW